MGTAVTVIEASGDLEMRDVARIKTELNALIAKDQLKIVLDLGRVDYINPLAIGILMERRHTLLNLQGELKLARQTTWCRKIFQHYGVAEYFESYASIDDAIHSFGEEWEGESRE